MASVLVLMGGDTSEREVSLRSGKAVSFALQRNGHKVFTMDLSYRYKGNLPTNPLPKATVDEPALCSPTELSQWITVLNPDAVFPILHGGYGEDGKLQAVLELLSVPNASPPPCACMLAMNKVHFKRLLIAEGIPTPSYIRALKDEFESDREKVMDLIEQAIGYPCVVKPSSQGSTVGASLIEKPDRNELQQALTKAFRYDAESLVETKIEGKEVTVAVLGADKLTQALPVIEIVLKTRFFDYGTKYTPGMAEHRIPPSIPETIQRQAQNLAIRVHNLLGCRAVTRTDMMVNESNEIFVLELNAIPGMTEISLVPEAAKAAGINFEELMERLLQEALSNSPNK